MLKKFTLNKMLHVSLNGEHTRKLGGALAAVSICTQFYSVDGASRLDIFGSKPVVGFGTDEMETAGRGTTRRISWYLTWTS